MIVYLTREEAARRLGVSVFTLGTFARAGLLHRYYPSGRVGRGLRFEQTEVEALAQAREPRLAPGREREMDYPSTTTAIDVISEGR